MASPQNTMDSYSTPSNSHHNSDGYDTDLLARAPQLTREQIQEGYDETLLNRTPKPANSPSSGRRSMPLGAAAPVFPGSSDNGEDSLTGGGVDGRGLYSAVGEKIVPLRNPKDFSNDDIESSRAIATKKPWYKRPLILAIIAAIIAIIVIAVAVPVAVTSSKGSNKSSGSTSSSSVASAPSAVGATPAESIQATNSGTDEATTSGTVQVIAGPSTVTSQVTRSPNGAQTVTTESPVASSTPVAAGPGGSRVRRNRRN